MKTQNENEMFRQNAELKYAIKIEVYDNFCQTIFIGKDGEVLKAINYHNVVGVLETQKQHLMWKQRESTLSKKLKPKATKIK